MLSWRDVLDQDVRRQEAERQAQHWRMVQAAQAQRPSWGNRVGGLMVRLGAWMETTGCRMQSRFAEIESTAILAANTPAVETHMKGCS